MDAKSAVVMFVRSMTDECFIGSPGLKDSSFFSWWSGGGCQALDECGRIGLIHSFVARFSWVFYFLLLRSRGVHIVGQSVRRL
jgi:hypothetical protein